MADLVPVLMFKARAKTRRFRKNQKVWVRALEQNHLQVWFRWRGSGTYVQGTIDRFHKAVGKLHTIKVDSGFARQIEGWDE